MISKQSLRSDEHTHLLFRRILNPTMNPKVLYRSDPMRSYESNVL